MASTTTTYDCSRLLQYAVRAESDCAAAAAAASSYNNAADAAAAAPTSAAATTTSFGHPDPPLLHLFAVEEPPPLPNSWSPTAAAAAPLLSCSLLVAYTKHTVSAQLILQKQQHRAGGGVVLQQDDPKEICMLLPENGSSIEHGHVDDDDEQISCLTVVAWKPPPQQQQQRRMQASVSSSSITSTSSLMKGVILTEQERSSDDDRTDFCEATTTTTTTIPSAQHCPHQRRLAIVFGTNHSRVYTVEVTITATSNNTNSPSSKNVTWTLQRVQLHDATSSRSSLFQVFPMDDMMSHDSSARRRRRRLWERKSSQSNTFNHPAGVGVATPFGPTGGVVSLSSYHCATAAVGTVVVWITYGDTTLVRLHSAALFPSLWQRAAASGLSVEEETVRLLRLEPGGGGGVDAAPKTLVRCQVCLPPEEVDQVLVVPLPRHYPSPLSPLRMLLPSPFTVLQEYNNNNSGDPNNCDQQQPKAIVMEEVYEALVFGQGTNNLFPTFCFFTSEGRFDDRESAGGGKRKNESSSSEFTSPSNDDGRILGSVTKALVGSAMGALRWGFGSSTSSNTLDSSSRHRNVSSKLDYSSQVRAMDEDGRDPTDVDDGEMSEHAQASSPFPSLWSRPVELYASTEFHDAPRKIEFCSIDPDGKLAAAADGLGRVLLIDLATKQVIRMWKGFREASCYWLQTEDPRQQRPLEDTISPWRQGRRKKPQLHLVIHSRQRRVVEVWRVRHGGRIRSIPVGRDARILPFTSWSASSTEPLASCYLVHSTVPGTNLNQMELIRVEEQQEFVAAGHSTPPRSVDSAAGVTSVASTPSRKSALRLQHLQQLLSAGNIQYSKEDVQKALHEIKSLADLSTALDLLAAGSVLEERLGVKGSTFHRDAVTYCRGVLNAAVHRGKSRSDTMSRENPHVQILSHKIEYHTQVRVQSCKRFDFRSCVNRDFTCDCRL